MRNLPDETSGRLEGPMPLLGSGMGLRRLAEGLEQRQGDRVFNRPILRMPLNSQGKIPGGGHPDGFDGAVGGGALGGQTGRQAVDSLPVERVYLYFGCAQNLGKLTV